MAKEVQNLHHDKIKLKAKIEELKCNLDEIRSDLDRKTILLNSSDTNRKAFKEQVEALEQEKNDLISKYIGEIDDLKFLLE